MVRLSVLALSLALTACATDQPARNSSELRQTHGFVVAALPLVFPGAVDSLKLRALASGREFDLKPNGRRTLSAWVPAGSYEIVEMVGSDKGSVPPIEVAAGEATDLGGLTWAGIGARQRVLLPMQHAELKQVSDAAFSQEKENLRGEVRRWQVTSTPKPQDVPSTQTNLGLIADLILEASEKANQAPLRVRLQEAKSLEEFTKLYKATSASLIGEPALDDSGTLFIGSNFGQVRRRDTTGAWRALDTGALSPITAVNAKGKQLVVGTMDGRLMHSVDGGDTWKQVQRVGESDYVFSIHQHEGGYLVLSGTVKQVDQFMWRLSSTSVHDLRPRENWQMATLRKFDTAVTPAIWQLSEMFATLAGQQYFVVVAGSLERLNLSDKTWQTMSVGHRVSQVRVSDDSRTVTAFGAGGAFSKLSATPDGGKSWHILDTPPYPAINVQMESLNSGTASRWDMGMLANSLQLLIYNSANKSWVKTWTAPQAACVRSIRVKAGTELCASGGGSVFRITESALLPEFLAH